MALSPPANDPPMADDGQHSAAWRAHFEDVTRTLNALPTVLRKGVIDGSSAAVGVIGELLQTVNGVPVACAAGATVNATSVSLTAGDWDVRAEAWISPAGVATKMAAGIGPSSAALAALSANTAQTLHAWNHGAGQLQSLPVGPVRISLTATTVIYLSTSVAGTTGDCYGKIEARRVR